MTLAFVLKSTRDVAREAIGLILVLNGEELDESWKLPKGDPETLLEERVSELAKRLCCSRRDIRSDLMKDVRNGLAQQAKAQSAA